MEIAGCRWHDDDDGRCVEVRVSSAPDESVAFVMLSHDATRAEWVKAQTDAYRGPDGAFFRSTGLRRRTGVHDTGSFCWSAGT
jgi:hypothetical protein